jgi:hypothetical protein
LLEGLVKPFSRGYDTGSGDTGQYEYISGSSIYRFSGGTGGTFEQFNGIEFYPTTVNNIYNVTQSWDESFPSVLGTVIYDRDDQREFYNGEFSGSDPYVKLQRGLGDGGDPCAAVLKINPNEFYVYELQFFDGFDNDYNIEVVITPPPPIPPSPSPTPTLTPTPTPTPSPSPVGFTLYVSGVRPACEDFYTDNYLINTIKSSTSDWSSIGPSTIISDLDTGWYAVSFKSTNTTDISVFKTILVDNGLVLDVRQFDCGTII